MFRAFTVVEGNEKLAATGFFAAFDKLKKTQFCDFGMYWNEAF